MEVLFTLVVLGGVIALVAYKLARRYKNKGSGIVSGGASGNKVDKK